MFLQEHDIFKEQMLEPSVVSSVISCIGVFSSCGL